MLYNIYRPKDFIEVKGQDDVLLTLKKQCVNGNFSHAYLFAGHRGTGKTTIARILSKAVNCLHPTESGPCLTCENCLSASDSLDIIELDAASNNGVDKIKELISQTKYQPVQLPKKVYIIDEVHNLSAAAFDSLLKTLEEPPSYCIFILCTTELHKIPVTILSRCELYVFHPIDAVPMREKLEFIMQERNTTYEDDAINLIIRHANGGLRDALSILEQLMVSTDNHITAEAAQKRLGLIDIDSILELLTAVLHFKITQALNLLDALLSNGKTPTLITDIILSTITDLITIKSTDSPNAVLHGKKYLETLYDLSKDVAYERLYWISEQYCELRTILRGSTNPSMDIRLCILKISNRELVNSDPAAIAEIISNLQKEVTQLKQQMAQIGKNTVIVNPLQKDIAFVQSRTPDSFENKPEPCIPFEDEYSHGQPEIHVHFDEIEGYVDEAENELVNAIISENNSVPEVTEGGMQINRTEAQEESDSNDSQIDFSASDLFKMLA